MIPEANREIPGCGNVAFRWVWQMTPAARPLTLAELLLKFGIAVESGDHLREIEARRELAVRFGVEFREVSGKGRNSPARRREGRS